jgi:acetate kinase
MPGIRMINTLLILNAGSSTLKFQVFRYDDLEVLLNGKVADIGGTASIAAQLTERDENITAVLASNDHDAALKSVLDLVDRHDDEWRIVAVVHRVVHGGSRYSVPVVVTPDIMKQLGALIPLAPLHQSHNLAGIAASARFAKHAVDIACFDTAFHSSQDELFHSFAIGKSLRDQGIRRYGFHGLSYEWIAHVLRDQHGDLHDGRVVVSHLGNGASLCALKGGVSIDTTMSMTALDGLPMGSRSGAIDPGAVIHMLRELGMDIDEIERVLYEESGLKGLSGISNDVETLLSSPAPRAAFALDFFAMKCAQFAAMMAVSMGGMDAMVFTGGIGEHAGPVRNAIVERLAFHGNFQTLVVPANEERMMAIHAKRLLER